MLFFVKISDWVKERIQHLLYLRSPTTTLIPALSQAQALSFARCLAHCHTTETRNATVSSNYEYIKQIRSIQSLQSKMARNPTFWLYDYATDLLTNKTYPALRSLGEEGADSTSYSYTPDGKLASRTWARGAETLYYYDPLNQMTSIQYQASSIVTPDISFAYNRIGQQTQVTQGGAGSPSTQLHYFSYGPQTLALTNETIVAGGVTNVIARNYDAKGRSSGLILNPVDPVYHVQYSYSHDGRFTAIESVVSGITNNWQYSYLTDQVGSVLQIVDSSGTVVNQYDYDAFGNVRWDSTNTFETVENRYLFQGREWDAHAGHYYFRNRTYIPEWGSFTGIDMNLGAGILGETYGLGSYLAFANDPLNKKDPYGLETEIGARLGLVFEYGSPDDKWRFGGLDLSVSLEEELYRQDKALLDGDLDNWRANLRGTLGGRWYRGAGLGTSRDDPDRMYWDIWGGVGVAAGRGEGEGLPAYFGSRYGRSAVDDTFSESFTAAWTWNWHSEWGRTRISSRQYRNKNMFVYYSNDAAQLTSLGGGGTDHAWTATIITGGLLDNGQTWTLGWHAFTASRDRADGSRIDTIWRDGVEWYVHNARERAYNRSAWFASLEGNGWSVDYSDSVGNEFSLWNAQIPVHLFHPRAWFGGDAVPLFVYPETDEDILEIRLGP